jgi:hypothetical protein
MSRISRRQMVRGALLGAAALGVRGLAEAQQSVPDVTRAGTPGSAIAPPVGVTICPRTIGGIKSFLSSLKSMQWIRTQIVSDCLTSKRQITHGFEKLNFSVPDSDSLRVALEIAPAGV